MPVLFAHSTKNSTKNSLPPVLMPYSEYNISIPKERRQHNTSSGLFNAAGVCPSTVLCLQKESGDKCMHLLKMKERTSVFTTKCAGLFILFYQMQKYNVL